MVQTAGNTEIRTAVPLSADDDAFFDLVDAVAGNKHLLVLNISINGTGWCTNAAADRLLLTLPQSGVVDVDCVRNPARTHRGRGLGRQRNIR
jgi:hypothetical protein